MNKEDMILEMLAAMRSEMDARFTKLEAAQTEMQATQAEMQAAQTEMQVTQTQQGEQLTRLDEKIEVLDEKVGVLSEKVDELDERSLRTAVLLESDIAPKVQLLLDGHTHLVDTLAPKKRVEKVEEIVEERVFVLESVVKSHAERITALEKAQ